MKHVGYCSIIQYCPDSARLEVANVGVVLFCPDLKFLKALTSKGNQRIRKFFGVSSPDKEQINWMKQSLERRLCANADQFVKLDEFEQFVQTRANLLRLSSPRVVRFDDPESELQRLYHKLVSSKKATERRQMEQSLRDAFTSEDVAPLVSTKKISVPLNKLNQKISFPFSFQNGRRNLIRSSRFTDQHQLRQQIGQLSFEGRLLYEQPATELGELQVVVVGELEPAVSEQSETIHEILCESHVDFYPLQKLDNLVEHIRKTAKPLSAQGT